MRSLLFALLSVAPLAAQDTGISFTHGQDNYLTIPTQAEFVPTSGFTVEAWITYDDAIPTGAGARYPTIVRNTVANGQSWGLRAQAGSNANTRLRFRTTTASSNYTLDWTFAPGQLLNWTHVAATYGPSEMVIYVNGVRSASRSVSGAPLINVGGDLQVGKGASGASNPTNETWNGEIDELRIWPVERTEAEIAQTMNDKLLGVPGRVMTWNFDNTLVDTSMGLLLTAVNTVPFTSNPLTFSAPWMGIATGNSTPGCLGDIGVLPTCSPVNGNLDFALASVQHEANGFAFWGLSLSAPLATPLNLAGVDIFLDPLSSTAVASVADSQGALRLPIPIPAGLAGVQITVQVGGVDACGPQGFTASNAFAFSTL